MFQKKIENAGKKKEVVKRKNKAIIYFDIMQYFISLNQTLGREWL